MPHLNLIHQLCVEKFHLFGCVGMRPIIQVALRSCAFMHLGRDIGRPYLVALFINAAEVCALVWSLSSSDGPLTSVHVLKNLIVSTCENRTSNNLSILGGGLDIRGGS